MAKRRHQVMWMWNEGENDDSGKSGIAGKNAANQIYYLMRDWKKFII